ncbi:MAG: aminotransferase class III-fold pyridoxal phosphate-dependent enzyme [Pseudomonadota bacterium]
MKELAREQVIALDKAHVWHPYTAMDEYIAETNPLVIARASGSRLFDADGRAYLDGNSSWWCAALGHNHPRLVRALAAQAERLCHTALGGITHEPVALLAKQLVKLAPAGLEHVFFSDNGSTSVEVALKMSLQYWAQNGRPERTRFRRVRRRVPRRNLGRHRARRRRSISASVFVRDHGVLARAGRE